MFTRWLDFQDPWAELDAWRHQMARALREEAKPTRSLFARPAWPPMALFDQGDHLEAQIDVPGLPDKAINVTLSQNVLNVAATRSVEKPKGYNTIHRRERADVEFSRSFSLPCRVDAERISATVRDGVLSVVMEKAVEAQPRQIAVKAR